MHYLLLLLLCASSRAVNLLCTNVYSLQELADYPLVGYDLATFYPYPTDLSAFSPCLVGKVCSIDNRMLPPPSNRAAWLSFVKGPEPQRLEPAFTWAARILGLYLKLLPVQLLQPAYTIDAETNIADPGQGGGAGPVWQLG